jgi:hypothetical protein
VQQALLRYYGNVTSSLLCNSTHHVTIATAQTHYYTTGTAALPWKCNMVHRSCYQGKPNMSHYRYTINRLSSSASIKDNYTLKYLNILIVTPCITF